MNSMVIRGREPIVVDTGCPIHRDQYLDDLFAIVEADDVRWVCISHDDVDHDGNLHQVIDACPNATVVASWFLCERLQLERLEVSPLRWRWVGDGESFNAGDHTMLAVRPPLYDSPTTRGLLDTTKGVYWASDCYSTPVNTGTAFVDQLPRGRRDSTRSSTGSARGSPSLMAIGSPASAAALNGSNPRRSPPRTARPSPPPTRPERSNCCKACPPPPVPQPDQTVLDQIVATMKPS